MVFSAATVLTDMLIKVSVGAEITGDGESKSKYLLEPIRGEGHE